MLAKRLTTIAIILPVGIFFVALGGWFYTFFIAIILAIAAWEYWQIYQKGGYAPNAPVLFSAVVVLVFTRSQFGLEGSDIIFAVAVLAAMAFHTISYELGQPNPSIDFGITLGGILYIGWLGSYLISLRFLPHGFWWLLLAILTIGVGDSGAYLIGSRFGKNKMAPRVSPHKTWEGYLGGVLFSMLGGSLIAILAHTQAEQITIFNGLLLGAILGIITPLGDLGEKHVKTPV